MIDEIQVRGRVKTLEEIVNEDGTDETDTMLKGFREEINLMGLPSQFAINEFKEIDYDLDDNDGRTTEVSITYGKE